ncbi:HAD family hydrolase [bacterium]|nr:HAD family hydrolase [bacterium]
MPDPQAALKAFSPKHDFFVGIDSDGCAFDTMELKHKECFIPQLIKHWGLQPISKYAREVGEFVNLYSKWRGANRFPVLLKIFDLLRERPEVKARGIEIPELPELRAWMDSGVPLGNPSLTKAIAESGDPVLKKILEYSLDINRVVEEMCTGGVMPFPYVGEVLEKLSPLADMVVVSVAPTATLQYEWGRNNIDQYVALICGQEFGAKKDILKQATFGHYAPNHVLMMGDAPGDLKAAKANSTLFYPICPGYETESWERFYTEALEKFLNGDYAGEYEAARISEFDQLLPEKAPWE